MLHIWGLQNEKCCMPSGWWKTIEEAHCLGGDYFCCLLYIYHAGTSNFLVTLLVHWLLYRDEIGQNPCAR